MRARTVVEGALAGLHRSPHHGASVEFAEHKEYSPGDEVKHIDWKAYGKFDKYYIKRFEEETELKAYLVIDSSASMGYRGDGVSKLDYARLLAAAISYLLLRQQDQVGMISYGAELRGYLPPRARGGHLHDMLLALDALDAGGRTDLPRAIAYLSEVAHRRSLLVVFSDLLDSPPPEVRRLLRGLRARRHDVVLFQLLDHDELTLPFDGTSVFQSMEDERRLLAEPADVRRAYLDELAQAHRRLSARAGRGRRRVPPGGHLAAAVGSAAGILDRALSSEPALMHFLAPGFALFARLVRRADRDPPVWAQVRAKVRQFAALDLLMRSERKVAQRTKLRQFLLLAVRALAIAAVPLILAKPFVEAQSDLPAAVGGAQSAVIVLDDSMLSMSRHRRRTEALVARGAPSRARSASWPRSAPTPRRRWCWARRAAARRWRS